MLVQPSIGDRDVVVLNKDIEDPFLIEGIGGLMITQSRAVIGA
jgi:hypothetical protein